MSPLSHLRREVVPHGEVGPHRLERAHATGPPDVPERRGGHLRVCFFG